MTEQRIGREDVQTICHLLWIASESPEHSEELQRAARRARSRLLPTLGDLPACTLHLRDVC